MSVENSLNYELLNYGIVVGSSKNSIVLLKEGNMGFSMYEMKPSLPNEDQFQFGFEHAFLDSKRGVIYFFKTGICKELENPEAIELLSLIETYLEFDPENEDKTKEKIYKIAEKIKMEGKDEEILENLYRKNSCRSLFKENIEIDYKTLFEKTRNTLEERQPSLNEIEYSRPIVQLSPKRTLEVNWKIEDLMISALLNQKYEPVRYSLYIGGITVQTIKEGNFKWHS